MKPDRNRRKILKTIPALAVLTPSGTRGAAKEVEDRRLARAALEVFSGLASSRAVGKAYLEDHPEDAVLSTLMARLKADLDLPGWYRNGASASELRRRMHTRTANDYRNDDCADIAGCYMPITELRLCALSVIL